MDELTLIQKIAVWTLPVLFAITVHEAAHGWVAYKLGDPTAKEQRRLSFNPLRHIDPIGTLLVPGVLLLLSVGMIFGWAKPVPVNPLRLKHPQRDMGLVAVAGPSVNFIMALFWALIYRAGEAYHLEYLSYVGFAGIFINLVLMALNLLPILPLDGGRVLHSVLPRHLAEPYARTEPFGLFILLGLIFAQLLDDLIYPLINAGFDVIYFIVYLP
jgi:Zn-dependent protease